MSVLNWGKWPIDPEHARIVRQESDRKGKSYGRWDAQFKYRFKQGWSEPKYWVELRRSVSMTQIVIIVSLNGDIPVAGKTIAPHDQVVFSCNGTIKMEADEWEDMQQAVGEAQDALETYRDLLAGKNPEEDDQPDGN